MTGKTPHKETFFNRRRDVLVCLFLVIAILVVYWQVGNHEFVNYDDDVYVTENRHVQDGLTLEGIVWSVTAAHASNWHPLTWLSHMLDCQIYGLNPGWHHLTNLLFHIVNTLLLFLVLRRMTGDLWRSAFVAALFALHPLHVESVAWVAERKDVLSTFCWMLTMWSYVWYVEHPGAKRYLLILLFFILGLMAKPMLVTLPFVLLLLDYWPLNRFQFEQSGGGSKLQAYRFRGIISQGSLSLRLVLEKTPFFILAAASSAVTFLVQQSGGAVSDEYSISVRLANALVSYVGYIGKAIWPSNLAVLYPHPGMLPWWQVAGAGLLLVSISLLAIRAVRRHPYFAVGWLWYLGTLVPVIGLVQVGAQAMADRYTYVPLIGLFIMISWGVPELVERWRYRRVVLTISPAIILLFLMICTWFQAQNWRDSVVLYKHTLKNTANNYLAYYNLGETLAREGRSDEAISHFREALRIKPDYMEAHNNLGVALMYQGRLDEAISHFREALRIEPGVEETHYNLAVALFRHGKAKKAISHFREALRINSDYAEAHYDLGAVLVRQGRIDEAIVHFREALRIKPDYARAHYSMGIASIRQERIDEAISHFKEALRIEPGYVRAHYNLGVALMHQGRIDEAIVHFREALRIKPDYAAAYKNLQGALNIKKGSH